MAHVRLKLKYRTEVSLKNPKRTKAGNSGTTSKAKKRMPRIPSPLSAAGCKGWKREYETPRKPRFP